MSNKINKNSYFSCLGENIRDIRNKKGISQEALAEMAGCSRQTIANYESYGAANSKTNPNFNTLVKIATALECSIDRLTGHIDNSTHELKGVCEFTGLSEEAAKKLYTWNSTYKRMQIYGYEEIAGEYEEEERKAAAFSDYGYYMDIVSKIICSNKIIPIIRQFEEDTAALNSVSLSSKKRKLTASTLGGEITNWAVFKKEKGNLHFEKATEDINLIFDDQLNSIQINNHSITNQVIKQAIMHDLQEAIEEMFK